MCPIQDPVSPKDVDISGYQPYKTPFPCSAHHFLTVAKQAVVFPIHHSTSPHKFTHSHSHSFTSLSMPRKKRSTNEVEPPVSVPKTKRHRRMSNSSDEHPPSHPPSKKNKSKSVKTNNVPFAAYFSKAASTRKLLTQPATQVMMEDADREAKANFRKQIIPSNVVSIPVLLSYPDMVTYHWLSQAGASRREQPQLTEGSGKQKIAMVILLPHGLPVCHSGLLIVPASF